MLTIVPASSFAVPAVSVQLPVFNDYAKITSQAFYGSDTVVVNIQDLHNNKEVQNNICKLLENINNRYENVEVYMEGASKDVDFSKFASIGSNNLSILMKNLYDNDKLSGTEYFGWKNNKVLKPVERKAVYDKNIQNYYVLIRNKPEIEKLILTEYFKIKTLDKYLTAEQRKILNSYNKYINKKMSYGKFCKILYREMKKRNISDWRYPNSKLYHDITKVGRQINQKKVHSQLQSVLSYLKNLLNYQEYTDFLKKSDNLTDINFVFSFLSEKVNAADKIKYPDLFKMIKLREISSLINPIDLVEEERQKIEDILLADSVNTVNKEVVFLNVFFQIYGKLLLAEISSKEYKYYKNNYNLFSDIYFKYFRDYSVELPYYRRTAEEFNELNLKRNKIFVSRLSLIPASNPPILQSSNFSNILCSAKNIIVLVSGGFHTEGINELLDENKISHITLTPNVKKTDLLYEQEYLNSIMEQAQAEINAISKRPFLEQNAQLILRDVTASINEIIPRLLSGEQTAEQISADMNEKISKYFEGHSDDNFIEFRLKDRIIRIDGKDYVFDYDGSGKMIFSNIGASTTFAKNIKILIREALSNSYIRRGLGLKIKNSSGILSPIQEAEKIFVEQNILFSDFANEFIKTIFKKARNMEERSDDRVYNAFLKVKKDMGADFQNAEVKVSDAKVLIGSRPDGYGNIEEYGSLFYVVWKTDKFGADVAEEILISNELFKYLEKYTDAQLTQFFYDLFMHEDFERAALKGENEKFNEYIFAEGLPLSSEVFHEYIKTSEFTSYIEEEGYDTDQIRLLTELEKIISEHNKKNSEYSDIISLFSVEGKPAYSTRELETFLAIRTGEENVINECIAQLAEKTYSRLEKMYITQQKNINPDYDIRKDIDNFIKFLNEFVVVYRKTNKYMTPDKLADYIKTKVVEEFSVSKEKASEISIKAFEFSDVDEKTKYEKIEFDKAVKSKTVLVVEDIISKQSRTFNNIYNSLMNMGADGVLGLAFFDLSKEPEKNNNMISDKTFERIIAKPAVLLNVLKGVNGKTKKYVTYWLTRLAADEKGQDIIKQISAMDKEVVKNLLHSLFDVLKNNETVKGVVSYDIVNLILFIGLGEKKDITNISKQELDGLLEKYGFEQDNKNFEPLEISYDKWEKDIPALIVYSYMSGHQFIKALGVNDIDATENKYNRTNKILIEDMCMIYSISFEDIKRKQKMSHYRQDAEYKKDESVKELDKFLKEAREKFETGISTLAEEYNVKKRKLGKEKRKAYLKKVDSLENEYKKAVKYVMLRAKEITLQHLAEEKIKIDDNMFLILVGGSLAKGSMMVNSDVYYDIIVPDGTISKSIELRFVPVYSSILNQIGLINYHVLKQPTSGDKHDAGTFFDERDVASFLNYEIISNDERKKSLYDRYINSVYSHSFTDPDSTLSDLALINKRYRSISNYGSGWVDSSFIVSYDDSRKEVFSTRSILMSFETKLNEIFFKYLLNLPDENIDVSPRVSIQDQLSFIRDVIYKENEEKQAYLDNVFEAWQFLASCRYVNRNDSWTPFLPGEQEAINIINDFVTKNSPLPLEDIHAAELQAPIREINNCRDLLKLVNLVRNDYEKPEHLEAWKQFDDGKNEETFLFAEAIYLLMEIDSYELREKLKGMKIKGLDKYLDRLFRSIDVIKDIDENFPVYSNIDGERSIQNYWDSVAKYAGNEETMLALIAHKLTNAQVSKQKEDEYLLYAVYLPLSKRFGNAKIYEYVRNDLFEYSHPGAYLNLLKIVKTLYGIEYSRIYEKTEKIKEAVKDFLVQEKNVPEDSFHINFRLKSLYSIYEKLNSTRRQENDKLKALEESDINAIKYILSFKGSLFDDIIRKSYPEKDINVDTIKDEILYYIEEDYDSLTLSQQKQLHNILAGMKNAIFYDYNIVDHVNKYLSDVIDACEFDGKLDIEKLKKEIERQGRFFELWFVKLFGNELRDLIGLHVVAEDTEYESVVESAKGKKDSELPDYSEMLYFIKTEQREKYGNEGVEFENFEEDLGNKQARLKIRATIKSERLAMPVELCFYKRFDHEAETYGIYNFKKISLPHYIYKMGREVASDFFENVFANELDYSFLNSSEETLSYEEETGTGTARQSESKRMIFTADGFVPTENLSENFDRTVSAFQDTVTCFVEYDGKVFIQQLPKGATIFDLATGKYFSDDTDVSVYNEDGEPLTSNLVVQDSKTYKIIRGYDKIVLPSSEQDIHTIRAKLIYRGEQADKSFISKVIKKLGSGRYIAELTNIILGNVEYEQLINEKKLRPSDIAERIYHDQIKSGKFSSLKKTEREFKEDIVDFLKILSNFYNRNKLQDKSPLSLIRRSLQIAAHYNLANVLELFEALDYGLINFKDIEPFYGTFIYIKTKSKNADDIAAEIGSRFDIVKAAAGEDFNLVINDVKYMVKDAKSFDYDFMKQLMSIENLNLIQVPSKNDKRLKDDKESIFITTDFVMPSEPFALKSLGNNVEQLVKNYALSHPDMIRRILSMTENIAYSGKVLSQEEINSLMDEYPVLMMQMLLGVYSQDGSAVLSEETPFLTQEETELLRSELQAGLSSDGVSVSDIKIAVSKSLDLAESTDSYSFATLDVSEGTATLFISEAFLRMLDKLPANEKEYFLIQLAAHETGEFKAEQEAKRKGVKFDYSQHHKMLEKENPDQKNLMDKAASVAPDVAKMRTALVNIAYTLQELKIQNISGAENIDNIFWKLDIVPNDIVGALHNFSEVLAHTLSGDIVPVIYDNKGLTNISLEDLKDIIFLLSVTNSEEKAEIFVVFKQLANNNESFGTADGVISLLENYVDKDSNHFMLFSEIIKYLYSDTAEHRSVENIESVLPEPTADLSSIIQEETSLAEQTSRLHKMLASA